MSFLELLILLIVAAICGALGQGLAGYSTGGCLISIIVGLIGAYLGVWLARELNLPTLLVLRIGEQPFPILWSIIGSAIFAGLLGLLSRSLRPRRF